MFYPVLQCMTGLGDGKLPDFDVRRWGTQPWLGGKYGKRMNYPPLKCGERRTILNGNAMQCLVV